MDRLLLGCGGDVGAPGAEGHTCERAVLWILVRRGFREEVTCELIIEG